MLQLEQLNEARKALLHTLAQRDVCSYDACPSRTLARRHAQTNPRTEPLLPERLLSEPLLPETELRERAHELAVESATADPLRAATSR